MENRGNRKLLYRFVSSHIKNKMNKKGEIFEKDINLLSNNVVVAPNIVNDTNCKKEYNKLCIIKGDSEIEPYLAFEFRYLPYLVAGLKVMKIKEKSQILKEFTKKDYEKIKNNVRKINSFKGNPF
jgi:hypothetical protein